jgi:hypothetical protein
MEDDRIRQQIAAAHAEALRVGDSPIRADRLADQVRRILGQLPGAGLDEERAARASSALESALRVLRRDDDGREAARHLQAALSLFDPRPPKASPFLDG